MAFAQTGVVHQPAQLALPQFQRPVDNSPAIGVHADVGPDIAQPFDLPLGRLSSLRVASGDQHLRAGAAENFGRRAPDPVGSPCNNDHFLRRPFCAACSSS